MFEDVGKNVYSLSALFPSEVSMPVLVVALVCSQSRVMPTQTEAVFARSSSWLEAVQHWTGRAEGAAKHQRASKWGQLWARAGTTPAVTAVMKHAISTKVHCFP